MPNATTASEWDEEFRAGRWAFLKGIEEAGRTGIIAAWLRHTGNSTSVLDVGCGEAVLFHQLERSKLHTYVGVDLSPVALSAAKVDSGISRLVDLQSFEPAENERFAGVVFNEVLHFAEDPGAQLRRYADYLAPGGVMAVSMYAPWKETGGGYAKVLAMEEATQDPFWTVLDALELKSSAKDVRWRLRLLRPSESGSAE